jgi:peptidoglycan/xylan/chitin deacetylase (PgdA/CDA1 family)
VTTIPVLLYHAVGDDRSGPLGAFTCPVGAFREQMAWIADQGFTTITIGELTRAHLGVHPLPSNPLAITFDDGLADFWDNALPVLRAHGFASTMFVTTAGMWGRQPRGLAGRPTMSREQVRHLPACGVEVGSHGHDHPQLDLVRRQRVVYELCTSKDLLEQTVQQEVSSFAYPHGYSTRRIRGLVAAAGYTSACAVRNQVSHLDDDRFALARVMLTSDQSVPFLQHGLCAGGLRRARHPDRVRSRLWRWGRAVTTRGRPLVEVADL